MKEAQPQQSQEVQVKRIEINDQDTNKPSTHHINRFALFTVIIGCLLIAGLYGYYFVKSETLTTQTIQPTSIPTSTIPTSIVPTSPTLVLPTSEPLSTKSFTKRQFDVTEKFFSTQAFPESILNVKQNDLISMRCAERYEDHYPEDKQPNYWIEDLHKQVQLTDARLLSLVSSANNTLPSGNDSSIRVCETEDGKYIIIYSVTHSGGGAGDDTYFASANVDNTLQNIITLPWDRSAYFLCFRPLQLTKNNLLYYQCNGGEGNVASIYEVDLNNYTNRLFYQCRNTKPFTYDSKLECK